VNFVVEFQVSRASPWDGDHSEARKKNPESRIQKEARSQEGSRIQKRMSCPEI
jgi:hypothetical protein